MKELTVPPPEKGEFAVDPIIYYLLHVKNLAQKRHPSISGIIHETIQRVSSELNNVSENTNNSRPALSDSRVEPRGDTTLGYASALKKNNQTSLLLQGI